MLTRRLHSPSIRWLLLLSVVAPVAVTGCRSNWQASTNAPAERVAGSRQEDETTRILREASLPESFVYGGRAWRANRVHWVDPSSSSSGAGTTSDTMPEQSRPSNRTNDTSSTPSTSSGSAASSTSTSITGGTASGLAGAIGNFVPVADLLFQGHQIYRQIGVNEGLTDNIFVRAANVSPRTTTGTGVGTSGTAGTASPGAAENNAQTPAEGAQQVAFVEYDATGEPAQLEVSQVLSATGLPQTVTVNGKTYTAREMQAFDADVFRNLKPVSQMVMGHRALRSDDPDTLYLMTEGTAAAAGTTGGNAPAGTPGAGQEQATEGGNAPSGGTGMDLSTAMQGPLFVRYEVVSGARGGAPSQQ